LCEKFPALSTEKLRARIFDGPQIRVLLDKYFPLTMTTLGKMLGRSFTAVVENFFRNFEVLKYHDLSKQLLNSYEQLGCNMSVKVNFLHSHVNYFSESLEA